MSTLENVIGFSKTEGERKERVERKGGGMREREKEREGGRERNQAQHWWIHFAGEKLMQSLGVRKRTVCLKAFLEAYSDLRRKNKTDIQVNDRLFSEAG